MSRLRNNRGIVLPIILLIILILTFIGTAFWRYSVQDTIYAEKNEKRMQAYYLARSGADALAQYIIDNPDDIDMKQFVDQLVAAPQSEPTYISNEVDGYFQVEVSRDEGLIIIESVGTVDDVSRKAVLTLREVVNGSDDEWTEPPLDMAVFSNTNLLLKGTNKKKEIRIVGNVATNSTGSDSVELRKKVLIDGKLFIGPDGKKEEVLVGDPSIIKGVVVENLPSKRIYDLPPFPEFPEDLPWCGSLQVGNDCNIDEDGEYDDITVGGKLTIHIGDKDLTLKVNTLTVDGSIVLNKTGNGRLYLYINDYINLKNKARVNEDGVPEDIFVYYKGQTISPKGGTKFVACLYAESATIKLNGNETIIGHIITGGEKVEIKGNSGNNNLSILYAPKANVNISGNSKTSLRGVLVCNSLDAQSYLNIKYDNSIEKTFPEFWRGGGDDTVVYKMGKWK